MGTVFLMEKRNFLVLESWCFAIEQSCQKAEDIYEVNFKLFILHKIFSKLDNCCSSKFVCTCHTGLICYVIQLNFCFCFVCVLQFANSLFAPVVPTVFSCLKFAACEKI